MTQRSSHTNRLAAAGLTCAVAMGAIFLAGTPAAAQTAPASQPGCSLSTTGTGNTGEPAAASFACIADLDGNGISELIVGSIYDVSGQGGYALYITNNGIIRKKICWGSTGCPTSP